ncbi:hypothetical protein F442_04414 [Phytophthora nicotianae P10297]|uniref:Uncharacterized protein n=3 Tax=Phytophthora nicotianae TaxID=4792 RepID=W2ZSB7_PHYNI|nr:hypothetical protein L915_04267 [Phytophthora nicotianae]ETO81255.1 hypothetical protein F444_04408 [Phytophthora nicotianae P1976]ETP50207.1 hypothetical protein F442_04414 [Phytophthora nicotianae P10297]
MTELGGDSSRQRKKTVATAIAHGHHFRREDTMGTDSLMTRATRAREFLLWKLPDGALEAHGGLDGLGGLVCQLETDKRYWTGGRAVDELDDRSGRLKTAIEVCFWQEPTDE